MRARVPRPFCVRVRTPTPTATPTYTYTCVGCSVCMPVGLPRACVPVCVPRRVGKGVRPGLLMGIRE